MYTGIPTQRSCATTWLEATRQLLAGDAYNVILDVTDPVNHSPSDHAVIKTVDDFLVQHKQNPIATVANTIFPRAMYRQHGAPALYDEYLRTFDALGSKGWGRYFERMVRSVDGKNGEAFRPLEKVTEKLRHCTGRGPAYKAVYEINIYDTAKDAGPFRGGQCLSYLSFKLHPSRGLLLTAVYRNHTYVTRCLGNLIGLGWLMEFVGREVGVEVGSLTVVSTHAELDTGTWGKSGIEQLVENAASAAAIVPADVHETNSN